MGYKLKQSISLKELLQANQFDVVGIDDVEITNVAPLNEIEEGSLSFSKALNEKDLTCALLIPVTINKSDSENTRYIVSNNPRLDFIKLLNYLDATIGFSHFDFEAEVHPSVKIGKNVVIEQGCKIAEGVVLEHNVVIQSGTVIGKNTRIRANASIGGDGFGFERVDEDGSPLRFPHLGGVEIGENVEVGSNTCIARGTLSNTIIKNNVKIDNLVHIAHNCVIDDGAFVIACAEVSGGVHIGKNAWVGPNASIIQKLSIGENSLIGIGAVVTKSVPQDSIYAGNPARFIRNQDK